MLEYASKPLLVRYGETDQMGIVHHSNYFRYFEVARLEWLTALGVSYALMEKEGVIMPVIDAKISYKTPALFDDRLIINIFLRETPRVKIKFTYEVKNEKNELICTGETTLAFLNSVSRKPIRCPESFISIFEY